MPFFNRNSDSSNNDKNDKNNDKNDDEGSGLKMSPEPDQLPDTQLHSRKSDVENIDDPRCMGGPLPFSETISPPPWEIARLLEPAPICHAGQKCYQHGYEPMRSEFQMFGPLSNADYTLMDVEKPISHPCDDDVCRKATIEACRSADDCFDLSRQLCFGGKVNSSCPPPCPEPACPPPMYQLPCQPPETPCPEPRPQRRYAYPQYQCGQSRPDPFNMDRILAELRNQDEAFLNSFREAQRSDQRMRDAQRMAMMCQPQCQPPPMCPPMYPPTACPPTYYQSGPCAPCMDPCDMYHLQSDLLNLRTASAQLAMGSC